MRDRRRETMAGMVVVWCFFAYGFLQLCSGVHINCTATQDGDQTNYTLPGVLAVPAEPGCVYSWTNASNHVLAHSHAEIPGLVNSKSFNTLTTSKCFDQIAYAYDCVSKGIEYRAQCTINCTAAAVRRPQVNEENSHNWIGAVVAIFILLLVAGVVGVLCFRKENVRICSQLRCIYTAVKITEPKPADVEAGNK